MGGVLHDYECAKHGVFEARNPKKCPFKGCTEEIVRVFLKAPGLKSDRTKGLDKTTKQLAMDYKMTNLASTREGESQGKAYREAHVKNPEPPSEQRPGSQVLWGNTGRFQLGQAGLTNGFARSIAGEPVGIRPQDIGVTGRGPKAASVIRDHENLQIQK